jgi:predicted nuclease of predicted toxin-antitoxin system
MLVTKDADFEEMSALYGPPPKVVWTRVGNQPTQTVLDLLITNAEVIGEFAQSSADALLILRVPSIERQ